MDVYIGVEGFTLPGGFVLKELCLIYANNEYSYYIFKAPIDISLSEADKRTIRYATENLNNLSWHDGSVPFECIPSILKDVEQYKIGTYGELARRFLQGILTMSSVTNVQASGFKMPPTLPDSGCGRIHSPRYCAKAKARAIKNFMENSF